MQMKDITTRVRSYTRDTTGTLFTLADIKSFINEGVDRLRQTKELNGMRYLDSDTDEPILLPSEYHYMLALYSASRCFAQDEQQYPAQTYMDEFENLRFKIELAIKDGDIVIKDEEGNTVVDTKADDAVTNVYFTKNGWWNLWQEN